MADELKKITNLPDGTPTDNDVVPFVDLATNTTKKALKSELKGDKGETGDNATVDAGTTTTLAAGQSATVINVGTTSAAIFNFAIPQGIQGLTGANGACVESVSFVGNDMVFVLDDASTITLTNAKTDLKGDTGAKIVSGAFVGDDLVFTLDDNSTATITGAKTDLQGIQGIQGIQGVTGNGISNISLISTVGLVKTYRITYTDDTTFDYTVTDGANGTGTLSSVVAGTNISIDNTDVNNPVINNTQNISGKEDVSNKENTTLDTSTTKYPTNRLVKEYADGKVEDNITDGHTTIAPSGNAVFDALALKASLTGSETLTNKRINPRLVSAASYTTDTGTSLNIANCDQFNVTAQAGALKFNNPGGTPLGGQKLIIRIKDDGTARALTYDTQFRAMGNALPTTTVLSKTLYMGFIYNATDTKWDLVAVAQEA